MSSPFSNQLSFVDSSLKWGFHIGKKSSIIESLEEVQSSPLRAFQLYLGSSQKYTPITITPDDLIKSKKFIERNDVDFAVHGSLLYNLAGSALGPTDPLLPRKLGSTINRLKEEIDVCSCLNSGVVVHTGSNVDKSCGVDTIAASINRVLTEPSGKTSLYSRGCSIPENDIISHRQIFLENSAGEGNKLGKSLKELNDVIGKVDERVRSQVGICIDTCHIFSAGEYDFGNETSVVKFFNDLETFEHLGVKRLKLIHLNDSKVEFGAHVDRHENLGLGKQFSRERGGFDGLIKLCDYAREHGIPLVGETPGMEEACFFENRYNIWDYNILRKVCNLCHETFVCDC
jgi:deoxyribonuclease-4